MVSSSLIFLNSWSLPTARARATAGRASTVSNRRLRFGNGAERIVRALAHARGAVEPAPGRHVRDRVGVADDEVAPCEMIVQHLVMTLGLAPVAVHRIVEAFRRGELEMHRLA